MTLGERMKKLRLERDMTGQQLGRLLGVEKSAISHWEKGLRIPSDITIVEMSKVFNTSTDYLLGNTNIKNESEMVEAIKKVLIEKGFTDKPEELAEMREFLSVAVDMYNLRKKKKGY